MKASSRGLETRDAQLIRCAPHHYRRPSDTITSTAHSPALQTTAQPADAARPPLATASVHTFSHLITNARLYHRHQDKARTGESFTISTKLVFISFIKRYLYNLKISKLCELIKLHVIYESTQQATKL